MRSLLKNRNFCLKGIILLFVASALGACDKQTVYHAFQSLPTEGWQRKDTLCFSAEISDSLTYYKLSVEIRNRNNYPYQNISLSVSCDAPDAQSLLADTLQFTLADKEGIWKGDGWGGLYQSSFPAGSVRIGKPGIYLFKIAYTLPDEILHGVNDIGIKLAR
ncbi:gliding motility lipoprotein GldH [Bacteroides sp.]|uniref:gliding motility lipoprotein GldH n=1 Tax=Bacteroides sp. TaxID=29523 RepID=UPI003AB6B7FC